MVKKSSRKMSQSEATLIDKWIFTLLGSEKSRGIRGRIRFIKEYFLFCAKYQPTLIKVAEFFPYHFGPYSTRLAERLNLLKKEEFIKATYDNNDWIYSLTEKGVTESEKIMRSINKTELDSIIKIREIYDKKPLKSILKEVYIDFPEYTKRAIKKKDVLSEKCNLSLLPKVDDSSGFVAQTESSDNEIELRGKAAQIFMKLISE